MRYTSSHKVLVIISCCMLVLNILMYYFLLGISTLPHAPMPIAWLRVGTTIISSLILHVQAYNIMQLFKTEIRSQYFFFVVAVGIASSLLPLQLFIHRFSISLSNDLLIFLARFFSFLYVLTILSMVVSLILANVAYNNTLVFILLLSVSALLAKVGVISFSKAVAIGDIFVGGYEFLGGISLTVCIISLVVYAIELIRLQIRTRLIISQTIYLLCFILALHILLLYSEYLILTTAVSVIMAISLSGYLRGVFVHSF